MTLDRLRRNDKWFLGNGRGCLWAPPFPRWTSSIGFWDECWFADIRLDRLFCGLVSVNGRPSELAGQGGLDWRPDRLAQSCETSYGHFEQKRFVHPANAYVSELVWTGPEADLFLWSLPEVRAEGFGTPWRSAQVVATGPDYVMLRLDTRWPLELEADRTAVEVEALRGAPEMGPSVPVFVALGASVPRQDFLVQMAQRHDDSPLWRTSVLPERFDDRLDGGVSAEGEGLLHVVQRYRLREGQPVRLVAGVGLTPEEAVHALRSGCGRDARAETERDWNSYFASVPDFRCSDPHFETAYWYRWYGMRLNTVDVPGLPHLGQPFVAEGIGFFRNFITYSSQAMLREASWMHDPRLAVGILDNLAANQGPNGAFPGHTYSGRPARDFYHADFATPVRQLEAIHPGSVTPAHRRALARYAEYLDRERLDPTTGLCCVFDQNETGQEYMSRYQFASDRADQWESFRVGGVDASVYAALVYLWLAETDPAWVDRADAMVAGLSASWDPEARFFCDRAVDGSRSPARPATGFYPLLLGSRALEPDWGVQMVERWLTNPEEFWLRAGFPATARSDPTFSATGEWKGRRLNCPWNGRSWPMANSHLADGLACLALELTQSGDDRLLRPASEAIARVIRLLFFEGDSSRPCCFEHYSPITGTPALYRGYDDYMHSWVADLILRRVVGARPGESAALPLPMGVDVDCRGVPCAGRHLRITVRNGVAEIT